MKRTPRRLGAAALIGALLLCLLPGRADAASRFDPTRAVSLTLSYVYDGVALPGVQVRVYRVARVTSSGRYVLTKDFADTKVDVSGKTDWTKVAQTLPGGIALYGIAPTVSGSSDDGGGLSFRELAAGLYLVLADRISVGGYTYTFSPTLLALPSLSGTDLWEYEVAAVPASDWVYDVTAKTKPDRNPGGSGGGVGGGIGQLVSYQVVKHWADLDHEEERPASVTIEILKNGARYTTQTLSERNNWTYEWSDKDDGSDWLVAERDIAEDYTVTVTEEGMTFVVTNSYTEEMEEEAPPEGAAPSEPPGPGESAAPPDGIPTGAVPTPSLPQTGQLWWPVPLMSALGLVLFGLGWAMRRKDGRRHEE